MSVINYSVMSKEEEMGYDLATIDGKNLYICRDDSGSGGWSLHTPSQIWHAKKHDDVPEYLLTGPAEWNADNGCWSRPNEDDLRAALRKAIGS